MEDECYFHWKYTCSDKNKGWVNVKAKRIENIIRSSKLYRDDAHHRLQSQYDNDKDLVLRAHKACVEKYLHPKEIQKALKRQHGDEEASTSAEPATKRRSELPTFSFLHNCMFCGQECRVEKDPKNPSRWRPAYICRQVKRKGHRKSLKEEILDKCDERNDTWASEVRVRISGAVSDLHAADARYHVDCRSKFMSPKATHSTQEGFDELDEALEGVIRVLKDDMSQIWNAVDLHNLYTENGGHALSRRMLIQRLSEHFGKDLLVLSSPGIATILAFQSKTGKTLRIISDPEDDDTDIAVAKVKTKICHEVKELSLDRDNYSTCLDYENASKYVCSTVLDLLAKLSPKLDNSLPALLIGNIITSVLTNHPTPLQISLAVFLRESKKLVKTMNAFGVTCTYDELLRFKRSVATAAAKNTELAESKAEDGLVQFVVDNFDADIASQNGKVSTHSLAMLMTQPDTKTHHLEQDIPRLKKTMMSKEIDYELEVVRYNGPRNPEMPPQFLNKQIPPLKLLAHKVVSHKKASESNLAFLKDVVKCEDCPEFHGYNTRLCRERGESLQAKTKAVYLPLIDMPPAHPDTIMTAMTKAQKITQDTGQNFTLFTADQQLYKVAVQIQWAYPSLFSSLIPRLGGMHMLMSFIGAVGTLMAESGLAEILAAAFGGVGKMLTGKKFPMNMRAMRLLTEELLRDVVSRDQINSHDDLLTVLEDLATRSRTAKMWIDVFMKPVLIMMLYVKAEREGEWPLHLHAVKLMLPYFFASRHVNYARYGVYYLRSMEALPGNVLDHFMKGSHVMRHVQGLWNGIWSDMFIETTFMRYGHGKAGIIGITLKPETLKTWALSLHVCGKLVEDISNLREYDHSSSNQTVHKEEAKARIVADKVDRKGLRRKLDLCIDPLNPEQHPEGIINVVNGMIAPPSVNVDRAVDIGTRQMEEFERKLPEGFYDTIPMKTVTMAITKKSINVEGCQVYDTKLIYSRVIGLQASSRDVNIDEVLSCELSPVPTALFTDSGEMRISKSKSVLKNQTQVEHSARHAIRDMLCTVIDGSALLWIPRWPSSCPSKQPIVLDFVNKFKELIKQRLESGDVYLVFDRYNDFSTKCSTRISRRKEGSRVFQLSPASPLPSQNLTLTVTQNKKQLIDIICKNLHQDVDFHQKNTGKHKLVVTGQEEIPVEIGPGGITQRKDLSTSHEEADNIIVQQAIHLAVSEQKHVTVLADDTDVYVILLYHYLQQGLQRPMVMESPIKGRTVIDIQGTVQKYQSIIPAMLAGHALTGCDTVAACFGIGKGTLLKVLKSGVSLDVIGNVEAEWSDVLEQATKFIGACYGQPQAKSMSEARIKVWTARIGRSGATNTPDLATLPPTTEAFSENVKRAHLQTFTWKSALQLHPPKLEATNYGWIKEERTKSLLPKTVPANVKHAPDRILKLIRCTCPSENPCRSSKCRCNRAKLACTIFCSCHASFKCCNDHNSISDDEDEEISL